ncbi:GNAT family protein [Acidomonas methanolica]|uniref:N-acetyltransferase n=1 Tax=Acidomonas methanolica NBRC 104435 TaxID=1231351 RepID=A0A023D7I8_ACIMT|nr:hypothetical protein [Acidomonas methanolica]TCS24112.1 hypothetical protein EDC31_12533 [Acidomonas methanolica]GAJ29736.1 N-acetyltransferase [Acidomonas methanolica NBRC 104435]GBQ59433.1 N-acetyltransferase GCN5 [Acidomonas methanolica]GEL00027.1 hypothetical protein AME01nite_25250 [Acidomonas methanolica NBRC 104435]
MVTAQIERLTDILPELKPLLPMHYEDLSLHRLHGVPLRPQYHVYLERDARGLVCCATLRANGLIVGYKIGFVAAGLHYETCLTALPDIFFIAHDHRGGTGALKLFRCYERELRRRGVMLWMDGSKDHKSTGRLFEALGFVQTETTYSKWLV